jgi:O-antigen/teichoic acid export membrane protein
LVVALGSVPWLAQQLGEARFGILTIYWILIGYFSLFDLGLGRAMSRLVATSTQAGIDADLGAAVGTGLALVTAVGLFAAALLVASAAGNGDLLVGLDVAARREFASSLIWIAAALPLVSMSNALRGILEGEQKFALVNLIRVPLGALLFLSPLLAVGIGEATLRDAAIGLFFARLAGVIAFAIGCHGWFSSGRLRVSPEWVRPLFSFGGWLTVSAIVGPLIVYLDRFVLTRFVPAEELAYYTIPAEIGLRLMALPAAVGVAVFPAVAALMRKPEERESLARSALSLTAAIMLAVLGVGVFVAPPLLSAWMGSEMAIKGGQILLLMAAGTYANSIAQITYNSLLAHGLSRTTAIVHFWELVAYIPAIIFAVTQFGLVGAAACWSLRAVVDALIMTRLWEIRSAPPSAASWVGSAIVAVGTCTVTILAGLAWHATGD